MSSGDESIEQGDTKHLAEVRDSEFTATATSEATLLREKDVPNPQNHELWRTLTNHGQELLDRFVAMREGSDLDEAVECFRTATSISSRGIGDAAYTFGALGRACLARFDRAGNRGDLEIAVASYLSALELRPSGHPHRSSSLSSLAKARFTRFQHLGACTDLDEAIINYRSSLELMPPGHPNRFGNLNNIALALNTRFEEVGARADLDEAIIHYKSALNLASSGQAYYSSCLTNLASALETRFRQVGDCADLEEAVDKHRTALEMTPLDHPAYPSCLSDLASALLTRFQLAGDSADLDNAISSQRNALQLRPPDDPLRSANLGNFAGALLARFEHSGDTGDLDEAIVNHREALQLRSSGHPLRSSSLCGLANALLARFEHAGDYADLDEAVLDHQRALELRRPGNPLRSASLSGLATALLIRFDSVGNLSDLDSAIENFRGALELDLPGNPDHCVDLTNLASALQSRFVHFGSRADLDEAIVCHHDALKLTPVGHPYRPSCFINLASALQTRFDQVGDIADLNDAIDKGHTVLELTPPTHPSYSINLNNLGNALMQRFEQTGDRVDLDRAMTNYQAALDLRPPGHRLRSSSLSGLANATLTRYKRIGDLADLNEAILNHQSVMELAPLGHPNHRSSLTNLSSALLTRFERLRDHADLNQAVSGFKAVLDLTPPGHPNRPLCLLDVADALHISLQQTDLDETMDLLAASSDMESCQTEILELLEEATSALTGGPFTDRLQAALYWVDVAIEWSHASAIRAYQVSLGLMDMLVAGGRSLESRLLRLTSTQMQRTRTLAVDGAACAISSGQIEVAVEILEQGRHVLLTQAGRYRTQVDDLQTSHPTLATKFRAVSVKMDTLVMAERQMTDENALPSNAEDVIAAYQRLSQDWNDVIEEIRGLDGLSHFLLPTPFILLRAAAALGPVIILNFSQMRTDAIIVTSNDDPILVPIPDATPGFIAGVAEKVHHKTTDQSFRRHLGDIWQFIVQPIVKVLQEDIHLQSGSRIWWCPTGASLHVPLHASGDYTKIGQNLPGLFVSSYTPTLSTLLRGRPIPSDLSPARDILIVGQSETPGQIKLPSVALEIQKVEEVVEGVSVLCGSEATRESVLRNLILHPGIHLACHGHVDQEQPFRSNFSVHDGPLTLLDITRQSLPCAELAFLAACHSAAGNRDRPDEVLHLTAGMQFAGFRSVVGTLWAICDLDGPIVAETFYSSLLGTGGMAVAKSSAHALHRAVGQLRMSPGISYSRWACFVHYGY